MLNTDKMMNLHTRITPQWLAGFFDGEGCVTAWRERGFYRVSVELSQKDPMIIAAIHCLYPEANLGRCKARRKDGEVVTAARLIWHGRNALRFLNDIKDYVICKKDRVDLAIEFCNSLIVRCRNNSIPVEVQKKRDEIAQQILAENKSYKVTQEEQAN